MSRGGDRTGESRKWRWQMTRPARKVLLLDIDGVLVRPGGYRRSYRDTVNSFLRELGLERFELRDDRFAERFEACEIPAEWDMVPLTLAMVFDYLLSIDPAFALPSKLSKIRRIDAPENLTAVDFDAYFDRSLVLIGEGFSGAQSPAKAIYLSVLRGDAPAGLFPRLRRMRLFAELLGDSLNLSASPTLRRLETYLLGSELFRATFGLDCPEGIASNLRTLDVPLLSAEYQRRIKAENGTAIFAAGMTARPDLPDDSFPNGLPRPFSAIPEAQCAFETLGWGGEAVRLIGVGSLNAFEASIGAALDSYLKPSPVHALAAIGLAIGGNAFHALDAAVRFAAQRGKASARALLSDERPLQIAVIEDSASGINAVKSAVELLRGAGIPAAFYPYGVRTTAAKNALLDRAGAIAVASVNDALDLFYAV